MDHRVGFWDPDQPSNYVDVDGTWPERDRQLVISYLRHPGFRREVYKGDSHCRMGCWGGEMNAAMGSADCSDGTWTWPEGYAHYLEKHRVKPPVEFIKHVARRLSVALRR